MIIFLKALLVTILLFAISIGYVLLMRTYPIIGIILLVIVILLLLCFVFFQLEK
jgi:hypothetical protein